MITSRRRLRGVVAAAACAAAVAAGAGPLASGAAAAPTSKACGAGATPDAKYVQYVYGNILGHCATASQEKSATTKLAHGYKRSDFVNGVDQSDENLINNNVVPLYGAFLGRGPTKTEQAKWVTQIRTHREDAEFISTLTASDEFFAKVLEKPDACAAGPEGAAAPAASTAPVTGDVQAQRLYWLHEVYCTSLDRPPTDAEIAQASAFLDTKKWAQSIRYVELMRLKHSQENAVGWIYGIYFASVGRPPSDAELGQWVSYLTSRKGGWRTFELYCKFLAGDEAYALAQNPPQGGGGE